MKRKTRRLIFFFATIGFLTVACALIGSLLLGRSSSVRDLQLAAPKDLQGFVLSIYLNTRAGDLVAAAGKDDEPVMFTIERGESLNAIANRLQSEKLIRDPDLFKRYLQYNGLDSGIEAGDFQLKQTMNIQQIAKTLQEGRIAELNVRIPQGKRLEEIAAIVASQVPVDGAELLNLMQNADPWKSQFEFLNDVPAGASLEGYIFPDTYSVPRDKVTARDVLLAALRNFDKKVTPQLRADLQAEGRTLYDAISLASIVEREAGVEKDRSTIAGVYMNRLNDGMALDADPTIQYGLGNSRDPKTWWPQITQADYQGVQSPYNTYLNPGLPPSPIANPALASIEAAINPEKHPYYFFRTSCNNDGTHVFAKTLDEQIANACP
jgi:UPF0755 protein